MADDEGVGRLASERPRHQQGVAQNGDPEVDVRFHPQIGAEIDAFLQRVREFHGEARFSLLVLDRHFDHTEVVEGPDLGVTFEGRLDAEGIGGDLESDDSSALGADYGAACEPEAAVAGLHPPAEVDLGPVVHEPHMIVDLIEGHRIREFEIALVDEPFGVVFGGRFEFGLPTRELIGRHRKREGEWFGGVEIRENSGHIEGAAVAGAGP